MRIGGKSWSPHNMALFATALAMQYTPDTSTDMTALYQTVRDTVNGRVRVVPPDADDATAEACITQPLNDVAGAQRTASAGALMGRYFLRCSTRGPINAVLVARTAAYALCCAGGDGKYGLYDAREGVYHTGDALTLMERLKGDTGVYALYYAEPAPAPAEVEEVVAPTRKPRKRAAPAVNSTSNKATKKEDSEDSPLELPPPPPPTTIDAQL